MRLMNVGGLDRKLRIAGGLAVLLAWALLLRSHYFVLVIGLILLGSGLVGSCPLYLPFGISTRKRAS